MRWTIVNFGKYRGKGKSLPQIVFDDPDWFFWALKDGAFKGALASEASEIATKATKIKIPDKKVGEYRVRYYLDPLVGKIADIEVIAADHAPHLGSSGTRELDFFDLSMARRIAPYDKLGGKFIVGAIKTYVFGSKKTRLTKERCEEFFQNPRNFG